MDKKQFTLSRAMYEHQPDDEYSFINIVGLVNLNRKKIGSLGPITSFTCSKELRANSGSPAKYSAATKLLDEIFIEKSVNAICSDNTLYGEFIDKEKDEDGKVVGSKVYRFLVQDGTTVQYEKEALEGPKRVFPFVLYALRNVDGVDEMKEAFANLKKEWQEAVAAGTAEDGISPEYPLVFSDAYHYGFVRKLSVRDVTVEEDTLSLETVRQAYASGHLRQMGVFKGMKMPHLSALPKEEKKSSGNDLETITFDEIKAGKAKVDYEWNANQKLRVPDIKSLDEFVPCETYISLVKKIGTRTGKVIDRMKKGITGTKAIDKDFINFFVTGKPGTGKTTMAYALGAATGMPVYTVAMTKNTEEDTFQGMNKVVDGGLRFVSTDFLDAFENGGIVILEEINLPDPSVVMGAIGQAIESPFMLAKDGYIPVTRHPLCIIVGTFNVGTYGSKGVNQALSSRFKQTYTLNDPSKSDFIKILMNTGADKRLATWVYNAYDKIISYLKEPSVNEEDICLNCTLRGCIGAIENIQEGEDAKDAIKNTLIGKIGEVNLELANEVWQSVVQPLPDLY